MIDVTLKGSWKEEYEEKLGPLAMQQVQKVVLAAELTMGIIKNNFAGFGGKQKDVEAVEM